MNRRVVVTGMGAISPLGLDVPSLWEGIVEARSAIGRITQFDPTPFDCKIAGEVKDFNADDYFNVPKDARRSDRYVQLAVAASKMAMADSGVDISKMDPRRFGVMVGRNSTFDSRTRGSDEARKVRKPSMPTSLSR